ncbi:MAG: head GIN domain-containing protein [Arcticibacter sp.]
MKLKQIILLMIATTLLNSCGKDPFCNCFESTGSNTSETRIMQPFGTIEVFNNVSVNWHQSNEFKLNVSCGSNLLDGITTDVESGVLKIRNNNRCNWMRDPGNTFLVDVYSPGISTIICRTVGDITCKDTIRNSVFLAESWDGTGTIRLNLAVAEAYLKIHTGPADIIANGYTGYCYLYNTGNGYIRAEGLQTNDAFVMSRSTGDCYVTSNNNLQVKIDYQGDIYYSGQPSNIQSQITGTGRLIRL